MDSCASPDLDQVPIDVTAGWAASSVYTRSPFNSWVDWSNVGKVSYSRNNNTSVLSVEDQDTLVIIMSMSGSFEELANKDFINPEDIFDLSARSSSDEQDCFITHYTAALKYSKLPCNLTAEPCVRLSDLQAINDYKKLTINM